MSFVSIQITDVIRVDLNSIGKWKKTKKNNPIIFRFVYILLKMNFKVSTFKDEDRVVALEL